MGIIKICICLVEERVTLKGNGKLQKYCMKNLIDAESNSFSLEIFSQP